MSGVQPMVSKTHDGLDRMLREVQRCGIASMRTGMLAHRARTFQPGGCHDDLVVNKTSNKTKPGKRNAWMVVLDLIIALSAACKATQKMDGQRTLALFRVAGA